MRLLALVLILAACSLRSPASALSPKPQPQQQEIETPTPPPYSAILVAPETGGAVLLDGAGEPLAAFAFCGEGEMQGGKVLVFCAIQDPTGG